MDAELYPDAFGRPVLDASGGAQEAVVGTVRITNADGSPVPQEELWAMLRELHMELIYGPAADSLGMGV
jgi:hypothetical protein